NKLYAYNFQEKQILLCEEIPSKDILFFNKLGGIIETNNLKLFIQTHKNILGYEHEYNNILIVIPNNFNLIKFPSSIKILTFDNFSQSQIQINKDKIIIFES